MGKLAGKIVRVQYQDQDGNWVDVTGDTLSVNIGDLQIGGELRYQAIDPKTWRRQLAQRITAARFVAHRLGRN